jgi:hypothetical protein
MAVRRGQRASDNFAQISNGALQDKRLSYRARGILSALLSRPPGWTTSAERIAAEGTEGRDAVKAAMRELEKFGYLIRVRAQDEKGHWQHHQDVFDTPQIEEPPVDGKPVDGFPVDG